MNWKQEIEAQIAVWQSIDCQQEERIMQALLDVAVAADGASNCGNWDWPQGMMECDAALDKLKEVGDRSPPDEDCLCPTCRPSICDEAADEIERLQVFEQALDRCIDERDEAYREIERLTNAFTELADALNKALPGGTPSEWMKDIERLQAMLDVAAPAKDNLACAVANCGKTGGDRDCSAYVNYGLRCSDCPVEIWLASIVEALDKLWEADDGANT